MRMYRREGIWVALLAILCVSALLTSWVYAHDQDDDDLHIYVTELLLVSSKRASSTETDYSYRLRVMNRGGAIKNASAYAKSKSSYTRILDNEVMLGKIAAGATLTSTDTFSFRQKNSRTFKNTDLEWDIDGDLVNTPPVAHAGPDQTVRVKDKVRLDGTASTDIDGDRLTYRWVMVSKPAGSAATLSSATAARPGFTADRAGTWIFKLYVKDRQNESAADEVRISTINSGPVANAGPDRTVPRGALVVLDGSPSSDCDRDGLSYKWTIVSAPAGSTAVLVGANTYRATIRLDKAGNYTFSLTVSDGHFTSKPDEVIISTVNSAPVANAGADQTGLAGSPVTLDGSASNDADNDPLSMTWQWQSIPTGSAAVLAPVNDVRSLFTPDIAGLYVAQLIVNDGFANSTPDTIAVTVTAPVNQPPKAVNDSASTPAGTAITINVLANDSDPDVGTALSISNFTQPLSGGAVTAVAGGLRFTPASGFSGNTSFTYTVSDGQLTATATVAVAVTAVVTNQAPVVNAGADKTVAMSGQGAATTSLAGVVTDDNLPAPAQLTIGWSKASGPGTVTFGTPATAASSATFSALGTYLLRLTASDGALSAADDVQVIVQAPANTGPTLNAIADRTQSVGVALNLQLIAHDNDPLDTLTFTLGAAPAGVTLSAQGILSWTPTAAQLGDNNVSVSVSDAMGLSDTKTFRVTVVAPNHAPTLGALANDIAAVGANYSKTLSATDPDGDVLIFELVGSPLGMSLSGNTLSWQPGVAQTGDNSVAVLVRDPAGASSAGLFQVTVGVAGAPIARDDSYRVKTGELLTVAVPGVLSNDVDTNGGQLSAIKRSDPTIGALSAFNANGGFTYQAPAADPRPPFSVTGRILTADSYVWNGPLDWPVMGDLDRDGRPDLITTHYIGSAIVATSGGDGHRLWGASPTCRYLNGDATPTELLADIDDDTRLEYVFSSYCLGVDGVGWTRLQALADDGQTKWTSEPLTQPIYEYPCTSPGNCSTTLQRVEFEITRSVTLAVARLAADEAPTLMLRQYIGAQAAFLYARLEDGSYGYKYYGCRIATGLESDMGQACMVTMLISPTDGSVQQVLRSPVRNYNNPDGFLRPYHRNPPLAVDLDGDGAVEIVSGADIWKRVSGVWTLTWQALVEPQQVAVVDLDGDGQPEIVHQVDHATNGSYPNDPYAGFSGFIIYDHNGVEQRRFPLPLNNAGMLTVADVDGDQLPEFLMVQDGFAHVINTDGSFKWTYTVPDHPIWSQPQGLRTTTITNMQVYDLDGDGNKEVIFSSAGWLHILDGRTGAEKVRFDVGRRQAGINGNIWTFVTDWDNDGHADILSIANGTGDISDPGSWVITAANNDWLPAGKHYGVTDYRPSSIDDAGHVLFDPSVQRSVRNAKQLGTVRDARVTAGTSFDYVANNGSVDSPVAKVFLEIAPPNSPPMFTSRPPTAIQASEPSPFVYQAAAVDPDAGDTITYSLNGFASNGFQQFVSIDASTGAVSMPRNPGFGVFSVRLTITATDSQGASTTQSFVIRHETAAPVVVPNVVGSALLVATQTLNTAALQSTVLQEQFSAQPAGTVIAQSPLAASSQPLGTTVLLTVSKGLAPVPVPALVGRSLASATDQVTALGISIQVTPVFSATVPVGQVIAQSPAFGASVTPSPTTPVQLTVSAGPQLTTTISQVLVEPALAYRLTGETQPYKAIAVLADGTRADISLAATWMSTAPAVASVDALGRAKALSAGGATIRASYNGSSADATLNAASRVPSDAVPPTAAITSPVEGNSIAGSVQVIGTATDANLQRYELTLAAVGSPQSTLLAAGTAPVANGVLGTIDPALLLNGVYTLQLTVLDRGNNQSIATTSVTVDGNRKIGLFSLVFRDIEVPVAGIPIVVTRIYDSRDKQQGDFGVGWHMGVQSLSVRTNRVLGTGWVRNQNGINISLAPTAEHKVTVVLPDGKVEEFDMHVSPTSNIGSLDATKVVGFTPRQGTRGSLQALVNNDLLIVSGGAEVELVDDNTLNTYDPQLFRYTTVDGQQIDIHRSSGVQKLVDTNGNSLTISAAGIIHSSGKSVTFARDFLERITQVTDPMGHVQRYAYDGNGDLISHVDALGNTTRFVYDRNHGLIDIQDPLGRHALRNEYDAQGRLIASVDAKGNRIAFTHHDLAQEELITDRGGNQSRVLYDAAGNVLSLERGVTIEGTLVNAITTFTYDALGNETSQRNPDGVLSTSTYDGSNPLTQIVDPAGLALRTSFAYNAANDVSSAVDPGGRTYTFSYDGAGNLSAAGTPQSGTTTVESNARGEVIRSLDALGSSTAYTRDSSGNITREEILDANGTRLRRVEFTYDANGNKNSETLYRSIDDVLTALTTRYTYDAANRLTAVTDPAGGILRVEYDAADHVTAKIDALGQRTTLAYDASGLPTRTTYPDGTFESFTYDLSGNLLTQTDTAGRTTRFAYDELSRRVKTTLPDGTFTQTVYSPGNRVLAIIDAKGNRTDFVYDAAGRPISTVLPAVANGVTGAAVRPRIDRTLTPLDVVASLADPNGHATTFQFDARGRIVQRTYADGSSTRQSYDAVGRRTGFTNEDGEVTQFSYDALGRLVGVSGATGTAAYRYDEAGNLLRQTDALGRITQYRYDVLNRMVEKRYPGGEREQFSYDTAGNLVSRTDANGRTTTLDYNAMNRLTRKNLPGGGTVVYGYISDGRRASVTDARGTAAYSYDAMGRLARVTQPGGQVIDYAHDANGNLTSLSASSVALSYTYDALNRLASMNAPEGQSRYYYDLSGNRVRATGANGVVSDYTYDLRDRPSRLIHTTSSGATLDSFANLFSAAGRLTQTTQHDGSIERYSYDAFGRLTAETRTGSNAFNISHMYDAVGNRTQSTRGGSTMTYTYNSNDQLLNDGAASYAYDANGNLLNRTLGGVVTQYGYDAEDRLVSIAGGSVDAQYSYDADGNRVQATTPAGTTRFLVDSGNNTGLSQVLEERDGSGVLKARYAYGSELASMTRNGTVSHYLRDTNRDVRALVNAGGALTDTYTYEGYGGSVAANGTTDNPYRYSGERFDADSGLYQLRARYYNPAMGRFMSRDPLAGSLAAPQSTHRYAYANSDPINYSDPTGTTSLAEMSLGQFISAMIDASDFSSKLGTACTAKSTVEQVSTLMFLGNLGYQLAIAGSQFGEAVKFGEDKIQSGYKSEIPLVDAERRNAKEGQLQKVSVGLASSAGKVGIKASFTNKGAAAREIEISGPPVTFKGAVAFKEKDTLVKIGSCGLNAGEITAEASLKFYGGITEKGESLTGGLGASANLDVKFSLFGGHYKSSMPVIGLDVDGVKGKVTTYIYGFAVSHPF